MSLWPLWMGVAQDERVHGVREYEGPRHNERILAYHATTSLGAIDDETPWCSSFVNWCFQQVWILGTRSARARSWERWGRECGPDFGAVAVLWRGSPTAATGHVGFLYDATDTVVYLLGGNQGNAVSMRHYPRERVLGFRWPVERGAQ